MNDLARRYALALYEKETPENLFTECAQELMDTPDLWSTLCSPAVHPKAKQAVLSALPMLREQPRLLHFFLLLAEKSRLPLLPDILTAYHGLYLCAQNITCCQLYCVHIPNDAQLHRLRQILCNKHDRSDIFFDFHIDPNLLGGFVLELDGVIYDQSVRGRLKGLTRYLEEVNAT